MKLDLPSFLVGAVVAAVVTGKRFRPILLELATNGFRLADALTARLVRTREDVEDLLAEARARARQTARVVRLHR